MRKQLITLLVTLGLASVGLAGSHCSHAQQGKKQAKQCSKMTQMILLRSKPVNTARVIGRFKPQDHLVAFYKNNGWYKAGDPKTGEVGWFNIKQYNQVMHKAMQPKVQDYYVEMHQPNQGPAQITAYKNGKKLSDKEAKKLYQKTQHQMKTEQKQWQQQMKTLKKQIGGLMETSAQLFQSVLPEPVIVIQQPAQPDHSQQQKHANTDQQQLNKTILNPDQSIKQLKKQQQRQ